MTPEALVGLSQKERSIQITRDLFNRVISYPGYPAYRDEIVAVFDSCRDDKNALVIMMVDRGRQFYLKCFVDAVIGVVSYQLKTKIIRYDRISRSPDFNAFEFKQLTLNYFNNLFSVKEIDTKWVRGSDTYRQFMSQYNKYRNNLIEAANTTWSAKTNAKLGYFIVSPNDIAIDQVENSIRIQFRKN